MTTPRNFSSQEVRQLRSELGGLRSSITGNILPALGLGAALGIMSGGLSDATSGGLALSSAGYGLTTSLYGLQDAIAQALVPVAEELLPHLESAVNWFTDLNEQTDGWAVKVLLAGAAVTLLGGRVARLIPLLIRLSPLLAAAAAGGAIAAQEAPDVRDDIAEGRSPVETAFRTAYRILGSGAAVVETGGRLITGENFRDLQFQDRNERYREAFQDFAQGIFDRRVEEHLSQDLRREIERQQREGPSFYDPNNFVIPGFYGEGFYGNNPGPNIPNPPPVRQQPQAVDPGADAAPRLDPFAGGPQQELALLELLLGQRQQPQAQQPQTINYFNVTATSYDDNELIRRLQSIFDQDAVRLPGRAGD